MKRLRAFVADDEPLAREMLRDLLAEDPEIEWVGECGDGRTALERIQALDPDLVFLDIEMPEQSGVDVARTLAADRTAKDGPGRRMPACIFITAYSGHAIEAFELEALDYVVKPFSDQRFFAALERAKRRARERQMSDLASQIASLSRQDDPRNKDEPRQPSHLSRIQVPSQGRTLLVPIQEVVWIESCDYYARVHTIHGAHLVRTALSWFEERLDPERFVRIHRGAIVHQHFVVEIEHLLKGHRAVVLRDGTRLRISRSRQRQVDRVLSLSR